MKSELYGFARNLLSGFSAVREEIKIFVLLGIYRVGRIILCCHRRRYHPQSAGSRREAFICINIRVVGSSTRKRHLYMIAALGYGRCIASGPFSMRITVGL